MPSLRWSRESELPAIAHGPAILARSAGLVVGLRDIVAYSTGLQISVVTVATGVHSEAAARQFRAPAEIDPATGRPNPSSKIVLGVPLRFSAADDSTEQPLPTRNHEGLRKRSDQYLREFVYETSELPGSTLLRYLIAWPQVGLDATIVELDLPEPKVLRENIIVLT